MRSLASRDIELWGLCAFARDHRPRNRETAEVAGTGSGVGEDTADEVFIGGTVTETSEGIGSKPGGGAAGEEGTDAWGLSELFVTASRPATTGEAGLGVV